ncbi:MATE family efflux transporter [Nocardioides marmorisolisilvae]|uniref:MATE family efflux transporter n=1 Tax=Nocardioides marmorisolisilvae TaxID=1542737 RepID=A0A3N0DJ41_9ACTN|nr:MATE family efflux transporter [Nocardioides marmorisolisilvae]RNL75426.1 MATE family efflux transporter [Nocardioides marmorisolisilvae]
MATSSGSEDREILRLAVPAFLALVAEPLFLLADSAIVGHLGTTQLAGLGIAGAVLSTLISLCIFLAYGTTASVARRIGAGDLAAAIRSGIDGVWLAVVIGAVITVLGALGTPVLVEAFGAGDRVSDQAEQYLRIGFLGAVPLLVMLAATGILRGLQDTRTPLVVAVGGNLANVGLNLLLVYGLDLGIRGSALGTVLAQTGSAAVMLVVVDRAARRHRVSRRPSPEGVRLAGRAGVPLLLRTITLRASLLVMTFGATSLGETDLAAMQIAMTLWSFLAFTLDAIAIAAQAITGRYLGAGDRAGTRRITRRMLRWGALSGIVTGIALAALAPLLGPLFTADDRVQDLLTGVLLVAAVAQPLAGVVFVLDGVLIGAGDGRYLAWVGLVVLVVFAPTAWVAVSFGGTLVWLWVAFGAAFMGGRAVVLLARERTEAWMTVG